MAFRAFASLNSNSTNQPASITGSLPTAAVAGDTVLIATLMSTGADTQTLTSSGPTAITSLAGPIVVTSNISAYLWKVTLAAGDVGAILTDTSSGTGHYAIGAMMAFSGRSGATVVPTAATATATTSLTSPVATTTADSSDVAFFYIARDATTTRPVITVPSSQTAAGSAYTANTGAGGPNFTITAAYRTTPGAQGDYGGTAATVSPTATAAVMFTVGLAPKVTTGSGFTVSKVNTGGTTSRLSVFLVNSGGTTTQIADKTD
jgi:hypothetical protein